MKRWRRAAEVIIVVCSFLILAAGCGKKNTQEEAKELQIKKIGVAVYNNDDQEVQAFRNYYEDYVAKCFEADFFYSGNIASAEDELEFVEAAAKEGAEGIISFVSYDLPGTVKACESEKIYYMMGSGTVAQESFEKVEDNPYFLGVVGPNEETEREAGNDMAGYFAGQDKENKNSYLIISGGGYDGNVMHQYRTEAILKALSDSYKIVYDRDIEEIAGSEEVQVTEHNGQKIAVCPGYIRKEEVEASALKLLDTGDYNVILSVLPLTDFFDSIENLRKNGGQEIHVGVIDCFTEANKKAVDRGNLEYVTGKYPSIIGPSFAAMYNAVTGHAEDFRDKGKAFMLQQGFWTASDRESYVEMYGLATGIYENAYDHEDLSSVMKDFTPDADFTSLKEMTEAYSLEDVSKR